MSPSLFFFIYVTFTRVSYVNKTSATASRRGLSEVLSQLSVTVKNAQYSCRMLRVRPCLLRKKFQDPSHQIFGRMHKALNTDENKN